MAKSKGKGIVNAIRALIEPPLNTLELSIWDVRYEKEGPDMFLRIFIEGNQPLDMDTCEKATRLIDPIIEAAELIPESYYMEVGSPGLGCRLNTDEQFAKKIGEKVELNFFAKQEDGSKDIMGILKGKDANGVTITVNDKDCVFANEVVSFVKLCNDENLF